MQLGTNMIGDLRVPLWQVKCEYAEIENSLKIRMGIGSVFVNVYDEIKIRLSTQLDARVKKTILSDLDKIDLSKEEHQHL